MNEPAPRSGDSTGGAAPPAPHAVSTSPFAMSRRDLGLLALLTLTWGMNWPVMKLGVAELAPMTFRAVSIGLGVPVLWLIVRSQRVSLAVPREHWRELLALALTNMVIWFILVMYGVKLLASGRAAILGYTMPIWAAIVGIVVFGEHPSRRLAVGVVAAAAGVALLLAGEVAAIAGSPLGTVCMLLAALSWGLGTHLTRRRRMRTHVLTITLWSLVLSFAVCAAAALLLERDQWRGAPGTSGWWAIAYNALIIVGFSHVIWFRIASTLAPVASGLSVMMIPVIGLFSGMAILGETPRWQDWVALGCILVAIASVLLPSGWLPRRRRSG